MAGTGQNGGLTFAQEAVQARLGQPLEDELSRRHGNGDSTRRIAADLGVSHEAVRRWLHQFGIAREKERPARVPALETPECRADGAE